MIGYFDTPALVSMLIDESGSHAARRAWDESSGTAGTPLLYVEARTALARAHRLERVTARQHRDAVAKLDRLYGELHVIEIAELLVRAAAALAEAHALRGYDAVHLAAARQLAADGDLVFVSGDRTLIAAASTVGLATLTTA